MCILVQCFRELFDLRTQVSGSSEIGIIFNEQRLGDQSNTFCRSGTESSQL
jgi:hypothetical protein